MRTIETTPTQESLRWRLGRSDFECCGRAELSATVSALIVLLGWMTIQRYFPDSKHGTSVSSDLIMSVAGSQPGSRGQPT
jgi:hypothetical protein